MLKKSYLLSLLAGINFVAATSIEAKEVEFAKLSDESATVLISDNWSCDTSMSIAIKAVDAEMFETRLPDLGSLFGAVLAKLVFDCPDLDRLYVAGRTGSSDIVTAQADRSDNWKLKFDRQYLAKQAIQITDQIKSYDNIEKMVSIFSPYQAVPGIAKTEGYAEYAHASRTVIERLVSDQNLFSDFVKDQTLQTSRKSTEKTIETALNIVGLYEPEKVKELRTQFPVIRKSVLRTAALNALDSALKKPKAIGATISPVVEHLHRKTPDVETLTEIDASLTNWVEKQVLSHERANEGAYLNNVRSHFAFASSIQNLNFGRHLPETQTAIETASFWFETLADDILAANIEDAQKLIAEAGETYREIDLILETGATISDEFQEYGFKDEATDLLQFTQARIDTTIEEGFAEYQDQIASEKMTLERAAYYQSEAALFHELSNDYPKFSAYVEMIDNAIKAEQDAACDQIANGLRTGRNAKATVFVADQSLDLNSLACTLYKNGHVLTDFAISRAGDIGSISVLADNKNEMTFEIEADSGSGSFVGVSEDWDAEMVVFVAPPPTGKPGRFGITECDRLAGDPNDQSLQTAGVVLEELSLDYDLDRAVDACIAAVEHDPTATRQIYQLARLLEFLGDTETAQYYSEVAATRKYAPAIHLQAQQISNNRNDDDAFYDAIDLLKVSSRMGYEPSKVELAELLPDGMDVFRPIPAPTNAEIIATAAKQITQEYFGGMTLTVTGTEVSEKSCFQTSATEFSCEVKINYQCDRKVYKDRFGRIGGDNPYWVLNELFASETRINRECVQLSQKEQFLKFTKKASGWKFEKEF